MVFAVAPKGRHLQGRRMKQAVGIWRSDGPCHSPFVNEGRVAMSVEKLISRGRTDRINVRAHRKQAAWNDDYMLSLLVG